MMEVKNLKLKVTREQRDQFCLKLFKSRRLFFLCVLGMAMVYAFNLLYNKAYVEINYVEYPTRVEAVNVRRENAALDEIMKKVEERARNLQLLAGKTYGDPFDFKKEQAAEPAAATTGEEDAAGEPGSAKLPETTRPAAF